MNTMQIAVQAVDALPAASTPFAAVAAPEQGQGFEKLLHERRRAVADAGGNSPESALEAMLQGTPRSSEPALPVLKEQMSPLAVIPAEEKAGDDATGEDTDLTQVVDPMSGAMQIVAAVTEMTAEAEAPVMAPERQADAIPAANGEGSSAQPAEPQQIQAWAGDDGTGRATVTETAARQGKATLGEAAPEGRGNGVQRPLTAAGDTEPTLSGPQQGTGLPADKTQQSPEVATTGKPSLAQSDTSAPAEPVGRTAAGLSVQQEVADRLAVSKAQLPSRLPAAAEPRPQGKDAQAAEQEIPGEALRQGGAAHREGAQQETRTVAQPATGSTEQPATAGATQKATSSTAQQATSGTAQQATSGTAQQATSGTAQQETSGTAQQATSGTAQQATSGTAQQATTGTAQQATNSTTQPATGQTAQPADSAPQAAAAAIGGQERKTEARPGQAKGEGRRQELRAAAEEPLKAVSGDAVTQEHPAVKPQGGVSVAGDADHADGHAGGTKDAPRKVAGIEGAGEAAVSRTQQVEQPAQPQAAAKATREEGALHRDVLAQIKQGTMVHDGKGNGTMSIRLNPGELGELKIQVHMEENRFKVEVHAENRTVRDLLMNNLDSLKEALSGKDLAMEGFDVSTGGGDFFGRQAEQRESMRQQATPRPMRFAAGYEAVEERRFTYTTPAAGGLLDLRL